MKRLFLMIILLAWLLPSFVASVDAATYHVKKTGNDSTGNGSDGTPWLTIQKGVNVAVAGDTLLVHTGTYTETVTLGHSGTALAPIIIQANGSVGSFDAVKVNYTAGLSAVIVNSVSWVTIRGFELDGSATVALNNFVVRIVQNSSNITLEYNNIHGGGQNVLGAHTGNHPGAVGSNNITIQYNSIHDNRSNGGAGTGSGNHNVYTDTGSNWLIQFNDIYNATGYNIQMYPETQSSIIRYNRIHNAALDDGGNGSANILLSDRNNLAERNILYTSGSSSGMCIRHQFSSNSLSGTTVRHNIGYNCGQYGLYIGAGATSFLGQNNIFLGNTTNISNNAGAGATLTTNKSTGAITDCAVSTTDFTHKNASTCLDAGTNIGLSFNGTAPDQGPFEAPRFSTCVVQNATPSTLSITFQNSIAPPLLPSTGVTGFTARKAGVNDVVTAAVRTGSNQVDLTLTNAIVNGNAVDFSYSGGNLTDSMLIGNLTDQPYVQNPTNQACTNNVGGALTYVFTQAAFKFNSLRGTEASPVGTPYAAAPESTNIVIRVGGSVRLRLAITCTTADCPATGFIPRYSRNAGSYTIIPDTYGADNIAFCGTTPDADIPVSGTATTNQLTPSGTFVAGAVVRASNAIPTIDLALNGKSELEYVVCFNTTATAADTYDVRLYNQDGTALNAYTVTPRMTLLSQAGGSGF